MDGFLLWLSFVSNIIDVWMNEWMVDDGKKLVVYLLSCERQKVHVLNHKSDPADALWFDLLQRNV